MGKTFEKQIKTIEDQGRKKVDALESLKPKTQLVNVNDDYEDKLLHSNEREIFRNIYNKRLDKIEEITKQIDNNLMFTIISTGKTFNFNAKDDPLTFLNKIKKGEITAEEAIESQKEFSKYLRIIRKGNKNHEQQKTLANINILFNGRREAIKFYTVYSSMILEAKKMAAEEQAEQEGTGLKILTPKQMLQRLPIALAQVKAGNNSESLLNEIRQIVYSLYQSKQITKKVYNHIIESIQ